MLSPLDQAAAAVLYLLSSFWYRKPGWGVLWHAGKMGEVESASCSVVLCLCPWLLVPLVLCFIPWLSHVSVIRPHQSVSMVRVRLRGLVGQGELALEVGRPTQSLSSDVLVRDVRTALLAALPPDAAARDAVLFHQVMFFYQASATYITNATAGCTHGLPLLAFLMHLRPCMHSQPAEESLCALSCRVARSKAMNLWQPYACSRMTF